MRKRRLAIIAVAAALSACQSLPATGDAVQADVGAAARHWAAAFNACDSARMAALYDASAVLWGTVSPTLIASPAGIRQYFERACAARPQPQVAFGEQHIRMHGETAFNSGTYTFTIYADGQARPWPARYSFAYRQRGGQWLIVDHHSSAVPAPLAPTPAGR